jgi:hypothetical protein
MRISERRSVCAIRNANLIRLTRLSKSLLSFSHIQSRHPNIFIFYNASSPFSLSISFKYCIQLFRQERRLIRKGGNITRIIGRSDISMHIPA